MQYETTVTNLIATWERAYGLSTVERGLALLNFARPDESFARLAQLTVGQRDKELLALRANLFGHQIQCLDSCPECQEKIEVTFEVKDIQVPAAAGDDTAEAELEVDGHLVTVRPLTTADLMAVEREPAAQSRRETLLRRCANLRTASDRSPDSMPIALSDTGLRTINSKLVELDPQADVRIGLICVRCQHRWSSRFDIVSFLWSEIDAWARRILAEVHSLALAYGWTEHQILSMSPWRRHLYLGMLRR